MECKLHLIPTPGTIGLGTMTEGGSCSIGNLFTPSVSPFRSMQLQQLLFSCKLLTVMCFVCHIWPESIFWWWWCDLIGVSEAARYVLVCRSLSCACKPCSELITVKWCIFLCSVYSTWYLFMMHVVLKRSFSFSLAHPIALHIWLTWSKWDLSIKCGKAVLSQSGKSMNPWNPWNLWKVSMP